MRDPYGDGSALNLDGTNFNILVVIFARCYHGGKLDKGYLEFLCIIS